MSDTLVLERPGIDDTSGAATAERSDLTDAISRGQNDLRRLLEHATRNEAPIDAALIAESSRVISLSPQSLLGSEQPWAALNKITQAVSPVSSSSICIDDDCRKRIVRRSQNWVIAALLVAISFQIYVVFGDSTLDDIQKIRGDFSEIEPEYRKLASTPPDALTNDDRLKLLKFENMVEALKADYRIIALWSFSGVMGGDDKINNAVFMEKVARVILDVLLTYVLPILYGFLGACSFILRRVSNQVLSMTLTEVSSISHGLRRILGAASGGTIGLFYQSEEAALSLIAVSFLCGYSVELLFTIADTWIQRVRSILAPSQAPPQAPATGTPTP
ncbi:MAG: hypothetical protein HQL40_18220 [Alphaproteobacteria bacterium]|nr:hypothetical protein [Alphaproteobacteria bacterium]